MQWKTQLYRVMISDRLHVILEALWHMRQHTEEMFRNRWFKTQRYLWWIFIEDSPSVFNWKAYSADANILWWLWGCKSFQFQARYSEIGSNIFFLSLNLSPKWNSFLANIHLCVLFHAQDLNCYGFSEIVAPIIRYIKLLESDSIEIPLYGGPVLGSVVKVTEDNLGLYSLFGPVESSSARYCCKFCLAEKDCFQTEFSEDSLKIVLSTKDTYCAHCQEMAWNPSLPYIFGAKSSFSRVWNSTLIINSMNRRLTVVEVWVPKWS